VTGKTLSVQCGPAINVSGASAGASIENNIVTSSDHAPSSARTDADGTTAIAVSADSTSGTTADYHLVNPAPFAALYDWAARATRTWRPSGARPGRERTTSRATRCSAPSRTPPRSTAARPSGIPLTTAPRRSIRPTPTRPASLPQTSWGIRDQMTPTSPTPGPGPGPGPARRTSTGARLSWRGTPSGAASLSATAARSQ
jgi:hypothetical protein